MDALHYTRELIRFESTSSLSNLAVSDYVEQQLQSLQFQTERVEYDDVRGVRKCNILGKRGDGTGGLAYFSHTDVVPARNWLFPEHDPWTPTIKDNRLYGRGSCDMKGSLACMLAAAALVPTEKQQQPLYIVATADEEVGHGGAIEVTGRSAMFREMVQGQSKGIIGEPTRLEVVHAHKGGICLRATSRGVAAHSSTTRGLNANMAMIPFLAEMKRLHDETLSDERWRHPEFDPPTLSWNIGINDHTPAVNITPPQSVCTVFFRPMPGMDLQSLVDRVHAAAEEHGLEVETQFNAPAFYVPGDREFVQQICELVNDPQPRTVSYGTDASMFLELEDMVVLGPGDIAQAHTHDEFIELSQLEKGTGTYQRLIERYCCSE